MSKRIIIIGATSGIGREVAKCYIARGWQVGIAGRRTAELESLRAEAPTQVSAQVLDVTSEKAPQQLQALIERTGGMDVFLLSSGFGKQNAALAADIEQATVATNVAGFVRMTDAAFHYFAKQGSGHIAVISSIAGTKGIGIAASYSATKRFQHTYLDALDQLARMKQLHITFTDIRPGFVATDFLKGDRYPMLMKATDVAAAIVRAIDRRRRVAVIDWKYRLLVFFWRMIPRVVWVRLPIKN